jgi:pimeloyl-ACP methyl ester carboxylesterase
MVEADPTMSVSAADPFWTRYDASVRPRALILMLHGGKDRSHDAVGGRSLSWRRSALMQREIALMAREADVSVWLLRFGTRGWNGGTGRIAEARRALAEVRRELGDVPVCLLGHSMGARAAVHLADDPNVRGVVALAPWLPAGESVAALAGKHLRAAHGRRDRITSFRATAAYVERAKAVAASAELHDMGPVGHYLLRDRAAWNDWALTSALEVLAAPTGTS